MGNSRLAKDSDSRSWIDGNGGLTADLGNTMRSHPVRGVCVETEISWTLLISVFRLTSFRVTVLNSGLYAYIFLSTRYE